MPELGDILDWNKRELSTRLDGSRHGKNDMRACRDAIQFFQYVCQVLPEFMVKQSEFLRVITQGSASVQISPLSFRSESCQFGQSDHSLAGLGVLWARCFVERVYENLLDSCPWKYEISKYPNAYANALARYSPGYVVVSNFDPAASLVKGFPVLFWGSSPSTLLFSPDELLAVLSPRLDVGASYVDFSVGLELHVDWPQYSGIALLGF